MTKKLEELWGNAFKNVGEKVLLGDFVVCDVCSKEYTESKETGGFIFGSYAYCPPCAVKGLPDIKKYGEEGHIRAWCPEGMSFADFVRKYRGPDSGIRVSQFGKKP